MKTCYYFLLVLLVVSCTSNTIYKAPEDVIPKDTMVMLFTDMYIATSAKNVKNKYKSKNKNYMALVYQKYKIDSTRFYNSNNYYTSKIEPYNDILEEVKQNIKIQLDSFEAKVKIIDSVRKAKQERRRDSIKKIRAAKKIQDSSNKELNP